MSNALNRLLSDPAKIHYLGGVESSPVNAISILANAVRPISISAVLDFTFRSKDQFCFELV